MSAVSCPKMKMKIVIFTNNQFGTEKHIIEGFADSNVQQLVLDFIRNYECSPNLTLQVGICDKPECIEECNQDNYCAPETCTHRIDGFNYDGEVVLITTTCTLYKISPPTYEATSEQLFSMFSHLNFSV
jgi:hypothetical protein